MSGETGSPSWNAVTAAITAARAEVAAVAPDAATAAEGDAYVMRIFTTCLSDAFLGHVMTENGLNRAMPTRGGPNPDYRMVHAALDPARHYRLNGMLNASERVGVGIYTFGPGGSADLSAYAAFDASSVAADGHFVVDIAADADGPGTLPIKPGARVIMMRTLHRDPNGAPARLKLEGGPPIRDLTLAQGNSEAALGQVAQAVRTSITNFLQWTAATAAAPNRFLAEEPVFTQSVQGDPDTIYYLGYFRLEPGEWLEVTMPAGISGYWSLHAYNHWCESLPGASAGNNSDGRIRIAIGPESAGKAPNQIDTLGRHRGVLICRVIGAEAVAMPQTALCNRSGPIKTGVHSMREENGQSI
jgi:hypothetical protein